MNKFLVDREKEKVFAEMDSREDVFSAVMNRRASQFSAMYTFVKMVINQDSSAIEQKFYQYAAAVFEKESGLVGVALAPEGIQRYIYPQEKNRLVFGHNLLKDLRPQVKKDVMQALSTGNLVISHPYELLQGETGIVLRQKIIVDGKFWGLLTLALDFDTVWQEAGFNDHNKYLNYLILEESGELVWGKPISNKDYVKQTISLPGKKWVVAASLREGWNSSIRNQLYIFIALLLFILILMLYLLINYIRSRKKLQRAVELRTLELSTALNQLKTAEKTRSQIIESLRRDHQFLNSIVHTSPIGILLLNSDGHFLFANRTAQEIFCAGQEKLLKHSLNIEEWQIRDVSGNRFFEYNLPQARVNKYKRPEMKIELMLTNLRQETVYLSLNAAPLLDEEKNVESIIISAEDKTSARMAEAQVQEFKSRVNAILENAPIILFGINQEGLIDYVQGAEVEKIGLTREHLIDKHISLHAKVDRFTNLDGQNSTWEELYHRLEKGKQVSGVVEFYGRYLEIVLVMENQALGQISSITGMGVDITELIHFQESLQKSEARYRELVEGTDNLVSQVDADGKFIFINKAYSDLLGYTREELQDTLAWDIVHPNDLEESKNTIQKWISQKQKNGTSENRLVDKNGNLHYIFWNINLHYDENKNLKSINSIGRDFTERKLAEDALRKTEAKYRKIFNNSVEGIFQSSPEGKFLMVNPALARMYGLNSPEEMVRGIQNVRKQLYFIPEDRERFLEQIETKGQVRNFEMPFKNIHGEKFWISVNAHAVSDSAGSILYYEGTAVDITEKKQYLQELEVSRSKLKALTDHLQKVRELERMSIAREIHDDLGQMLSVLKLNLTMIEQKITADPDFKSSGEYLEKIGFMKNQLNEMVEMVRRIISDLRPEVLAKMGLLEAVEWQLTEYRKRTTGAVDFNIAVTSLNFEKQKEIAVYRILQEALNNAARHSKADKILVNMYVQHDRLIMKIKDNGIGFPSDKHIPDGKYGLLGMQERAGAIGGKLKIESKPGKGTTIILNIPLSEMEK
ncbi:MAG: PAS domain S-box protein [Calditrichia bacterium]